jgi:hypothetical protein
MPNRTTFDEQDKVDHSSHPVGHATKDDLRAPGSAEKKRKSTPQPLGKKRPSDTDKPT